MVRQNVSLEYRDGKLAFPAPPSEPAGPVLPAPLVHWDFHTFKDTHLPPPSHEYKYVPVSRPLFEYEPDFEDVKQGDIGDCYLLSAINSMIRLKDKSYLYNMMGANEDHVHVRFYVEHASAIVPVIVQVQRTILKKFNGDYFVDLQRHGAVWPYFVEKADAFFRAYYLQPLLRQKQIKIPDPTKPQPVLPPWPFDRATRPAPDPGYRYFVGYVEALRGGNCGRAYEHLTGEKTEDATADINVPGTNGAVWMDMRDYRGALLRFVLDESLANPFAEAWDATFDRFIGVLGRTVSGLTTSLAVPAVPVNDVLVRAAIKQHIADTRTANHSVVVDLIAMLDEKKKLMREVRSTDILPFLKRIARGAVSLAASGMEDIDFGKLLLEFVRKSFPGKRGTGEYTDYHEALFKRVTAACTAQPVRVAFASTRDISYIHDLGFDIYVSDSQRKGLVPGHFYEISGTSQIYVRRPNCHVELRFVFLRNPWGRYVRSYKVNLENINGTDVVRSLSAEEVEYLADSPEDSLKIIGLKGMGLKEVAEQMQALASQHMRRSAVFPVELSDITKFFDRVQLGI